MVRTHGHLDSDETNEAAWIATRGAVTGAATVSCSIFLSFWNWYNSHTPIALILREDANNNEMNTTSIHRGRSVRKDVEC